MRRIVLVLHDIRSAHNAGSLLRTAEGLGVEEVVFSGFTPYPAAPDDQRLPHLAARTDSRIAKTALGAEKTVKWRKSDDLAGAVKPSKENGYTIAALEQTESAVNLEQYDPPDKIVLILGNEISGLDKFALDICDVHLRIPMFGQKESFNVAAAGAVALYHLRFL